MHISIEWHDKSFNVTLHAKEGSDGFLTIKGCRLIDGKEGPFVSFPARKNENTGKWWQHVWANEKFQAEVVKLAQALQKAPSKPAPADEDIPFAPIGKWL